MTGKLYLLPVTLGGDDYEQVLPSKVLEIIRSLRVFIVEDLRSARRFLRLMDHNFPIDDSTFFVLNEHTDPREIIGYLDPVEQGKDIGILSEAGLPCIADPGSLVVALAHKKKITVVPLTGPSSIILALIASGFNGQKFTFNGYLPAKQPDLLSSLKDLERRASQGYTQLFMETPYRAQKLLDSIFKYCTNDRKLCIATNITLPDEWIKTMTISEWKKFPPDLKGRLVVFALQ
ncbi:MAG TPA: SAM-dependent methyltransferase [Bacteroidales bacterium]|nr:SAM-dependent methyltransferase [Bacteroidales bacterium]